MHIQPDHDRTIRIVSVLLKDPYASASAFIAIKNMDLSSPPMNARSGSSRGKLSSRNAAKLKTGMERSTKEA